MSLGVESYSTDLVYTPRTPSSMNDACLDTVEKMSPRNNEIFREFKRNVDNGLIPPLRAEYDEDCGFVVVAQEDIKDKTLLVEYTGTVTRVSDSGATDSDSLMTLLETSSNKTSLLIDPTSSGNWARLLSGVNNSDLDAKRKINVRTRRIEIDGGCRVVLFSGRRIKKGERLTYDYNAGIQTKSDEELRQHGYYDTTHFM
jgi:hypothetical protein